MSDLKRSELSVKQERAILVGVILPDSTADPRDPLGELASLAKTAGANADGVLGAPTFVVNTGFQTTRYTVARPLGLAIDASGTLWVADAFNDRVLRFDDANNKANGALADGILGQSSYDASVPTSPPTAQTMNLPASVALDANGALWVADAGNNRVLRFDDAASLVDDASATAVLGQKNFLENFSALTRAGTRSGADAHAFTGPVSNTGARTNAHPDTRTLADPDAGTGPHAHTHAAGTALAGNRRRRRRHGDDRRHRDRVGRDGQDARVWQGRHGGGGLRPHHADRRRPLPRAGLRAGR